MATVTTFKPVSMGGLARRNLRAKPSRFVATMLAVLIGTGFLSGALVLRQSLSSSLESNAVAQVKNVSAAVEPKEVQGGRGGGGRTESAGLPVALLPKVQQASGVAGAAGIVTGTLEILGSDGKPAQTGTVGNLWIPVASLNPFTVTSGRAPGAAGEIAVDEATASKIGVSVGSKVSLSTTSGKQEATIVGLTRFGDDASANAQGDIFVSQADVATYLNGGVDQYDAIYVAAAPGSESSVVGSVQTAVGASYDVIDGQALQQREAGAAGGFANVIGTALLGFAFLALFVCAFIVYNTFSIIVAQRLREFALLRAIGADVKQIRRSVQVEALLVGVLTSFAGLLLGILLFQLLISFVPAFKDIAGGGGVKLKVGVGTVLIVMIFGTVITFLSAVIPSFRAGRTPPIAALQSVSIDRSGRSRGRAIVGLALIGLGVVLLVAGVAAGQFYVAVGGPFFLFIGVLIGGPVLAFWFTTLVGYVVRPVARKVGPIAVENVHRNPNRTATTANALIIGVFLVVFVTAAGGAVRDYSADLVSQFAGPDLLLVTQEASLPPQLIDQVRATPGVANTVEVYGQVGAIAGQRPTPVGASDLSKLDVLGFKASAGSITGLTDDQVVVVDLFATQEGWTVGSPIAVTMANGKQLTKKVGAIVSFVIGAPGVVMSTSSALAADPDLRVQEVAIQVQTGQLQATQSAIEGLTANYSTVTVVPGNIFGQIIKSIFTGLIESVNALLGIAVVIALFGIVNTLILSVTERTREIGVLRAVGMSRAQLRATIRIESVVVALLGTLVGTAFGLFVAFMVTRPLFEDGKGSFSWPVQELLVIGVLGVVLGMLASLIPAWRASRLDILDSIRSE